MASENTDWIREGATVAEYQHGNPDTVTFATIARLTASQIVLDNGKRYSRTKLQPVGEKRSGWTGWTDLMPADDNRVRNTAAVQAITHLNYEVARISRKHPRNRDEAAALLDQIEQAVRVARAAITDGK